MIHHLVREFPPGYGGVERVAHVLASRLGGIAFYLRSSGFKDDPLYVNYDRLHVKTIAFGRFYFPRPTKELLRLLLSKEPLFAHLPCPSILFLITLSRIINTERIIIIYWHSYISPRLTLQGYLENIYQFLALKIGRFFPVIVTSPVLRDKLLKQGFNVKKIYLLPCSLPIELEQSYFRISQNRNPDKSRLGTLAVICRLDSYKRVDWLIKSFSETLAAKKLVVLGDGPNRTNLVDLANKLIRDDQKIDFYGRVDEITKVRVLSLADVLVLPADSSNEAFGIVQLEAMASGIPAIAYDFPDSGMYWVSKLPSSLWSGSPSELSIYLQKLFTDKTIYSKACTEAIERYQVEFSISTWEKRLCLLLNDYPELNRLRLE